MTNLDKPIIHFGLPVGYIPAEAEAEKEEAVALDRSRFLTIGTTTSKLES